MFDVYLKQPPSCFGKASASWGEFPRSSKSSFSRLGQYDRTLIGVNWHLEFDIVNSLLKCLKHEFCTILPPFLCPSSTVPSPLFYTPYPLSTIFLPVSPTSLFCIPLQGTIKPSPPLLEATLVNHIFLNTFFK